MISKSYIFFFIFLGKSGGVNRWRVCYQQSLPCLVLFKAELKKWNELQVCIDFTGGKYVIATRVETHVLTIVG